MTPETLLAAGYKKINDVLKFYRLGDWYRASYQRRIRDDIGTRYFITIAHGVQPAIGPYPARPFFTPNVQFEWWKSTFNADFLWNGESLDQVETFYADLWRNMRCGLLRRRAERRKRISAGGAAMIEDKPFELTQEQAAAYGEVCAFINGTPELLAVLQDLDLLPEEIMTYRADIGERDWARMMLVVGQFKAFGERITVPARALSAQLHVCMPAIDDAFKMQAVRGNWYDGPTFGEELAALDAVLGREAL